MKKLFSAVPVGANVQNVGLQLRGYFYVISLQVIMTQVMKPQEHDGRTMLNAIQRVYVDNLLLSLECRK